MWPPAATGVLGPARWGSVSTLSGQPCSVRSPTPTASGGVYFNTVFIAATSVTYLYTGSPWLLIAILLMHVEIARQFLPFVRFDGYYILTDIIGVPDLFSRMGPVLRSMFRRREPHPRVQELKPWVRRVVTLWVILVIPALVYFLLPFLILAPLLLPVVWHSLVQRGPVVADAALDGNVAAATLGVIQMFLLVLPWAGAVLIFSMMGHRLVRSGRAYWRRRRTVAPSAR
jgi:putative peptide zinc metalloprotease protein